MDEDGLNQDTEGEEGRRDDARIASTLVGLDHGTDPFVAAVRATRMPMIITDPRLPDNPVVFTNNAFCRLTGYAREEIIGRNCRFLQGPETDPETVRRIHQAVHETRSIETDIRNYRKDGEAFWNRLLLAPVRDAGGQLAYFFASQLDVTLERERMAGLETHNAALMAELAGRLREQQERENDLRFALEAGRFGAWTLDIRSGAFTTSAACRLNFGRDPVLPFSYADLKAAIHPSDRPRIEAAIDRTTAEGADYDVEYRAVTPDGDIRWVAIRARPIRGSDGAVIRLSGVSHDITEAKRVERQRQALADLGAILRDARDAVEIASATGAVIGRALAVERAGYASVPAAGAGIAVESEWCGEGRAGAPGTVPLSDHPASLDALRRGESVVVVDARRDARMQAATQEGSGIGALASVPVMERGALVALLYATSERPRDWHADELAFIGEVAHRSRAAIERRRAEQELAELAASLENQVAARTRDLLTTEEALRQAQKMEAIGQLTGGVAHDFNNLLTVIRSSVDLMRRPNLPEDRRKRYIDAISETVTRASRLTGQLLAFARRQALRPEAFDVGERLRNVAEMLDTVMGSRIMVDMAIPEAAAFVRADASQFETALVNMAVNARDAMDGRGTLTLRVRTNCPMPPVRGHAGSQDRFVAVSLADTGCGIAADQLRRIFEPFYTTKEVGKGTGLGLSQVFGFAKQSGGDVSVESEPGAGTTFTLFLPEIDAPAATDPATDAGPTTMAARVPGGGGRRVLVVEDNMEVGRFSTQVLQDLGYETLWATNAEEALARLADAVQPFDIVFSDVVMPGRSGIELAKEIRRTRPGLPIVLTSGYSHVLAEQGAHGFDLLHKPYSAEQLSSVLRRAIQGSGAQTSD